MGSPVEPCGNAGRNPEEELDAFLETLKDLPQHPRLEVRGFFDRGTPVIVARAPGRLDVMGGIADYSGCLVLQRPIAEATFAAVQPAEQPFINIVSLGSERQEGTRAYAAAVSSLAPGGEPISYAQARALFRATEGHHWASYVAGALLVLMRERGTSLRHGINILISSRVPEGKGVASSA